MRQVQLQAVPHVEHLVHFFPASARFRLDQVEQRGHGQQRVFYHSVFSLEELQHFALATAGTMHYPVDIAAVLRDKWL